MSSGPFSAQDDSWVQDVVIERTRAFLPAFQARRLDAGSVPGLDELCRSAQLCDLAAQLISVNWEYFFDEDIGSAWGPGENLHQQIMGGDNIYGNPDRKEAAEYWECLGVSEKDQFDGEFMRDFAEGAIDQFKSVPSNV